MLSLGGCFLLQALTRDELLAIVDWFSITVPDRRAKAGLLGAVAGVKPNRLAEALEDFPRERLKELCRELDLDDSGREKSALAGRLVAETKGAKARRAPDTKPSEPPAPKSKARDSSSPESSAGRAFIGFESKLWQTASLLTQARATITAGAEVRPANIQLAIRLRVVSVLWDCVAKASVPDRLRTISDLRYGPCCPPPYHQ
jgi:hypothetical protein